MAHAAIGNKLPRNSWKVVRTQKRVKRKKRSGNFTSSKKRNIFTALEILIKKLFRWTTIALATAIGAYGVYSTYNFATTSPRFEVSEVTLAGNLKLRENELLEWLGPVAGNNIFLLNLEGLSTKLASHPWVRTVSMKKKFPRNLEVHVDERKPYARIKLDQVYVIDNFGVLLAPESPAYRHLPLVVHPPSKEETALGENAAGDGVISSLQTMHYFNQLSFFADDPIQSAEIDDASRVTFTTANDNMKVFMSLDAISKNLKSFLIVRDTLEMEKENIEHIDLSFKNKVVVKHKKSS